MLELVTIPNFILTWALHQRDALPCLREALASEGELELPPDVLQAFQAHLASRKIDLACYSGGWSAEFVDLVEGECAAAGPATTTILGAETIYSPFALDAFTQTVLSLMRREQARGSAVATLVAAKKLYFGVGGSLDDFVAKARAAGAVVAPLREEAEGVRRGLVRCSLPP